MGEHCPSSPSLESRSPSARSPTFAHQGAADHRPSRIIEVFGLELRRHVERSVVVCGCSHLSSSFLPGAPDRCGNLRGPVEELLGAGWRVVQWTPTRARGSPPGSDHGGPPSLGFKVWGVTCPCVMTLGCDAPNLPLSSWTASWRPPSGGVREALRLMALPPGAPGAPDAGSRLGGGDPQVISLDRHDGGHGAVQATSSCSSRWRSASISCSFDRDERPGTSRSLASS